LETENDKLKKEIDTVRKESEHREDMLRQAVSDQDELICQQGGRIHDLDQFSQHSNHDISKRGRLD